MLAFELAFACTLVELEKNMTVEGWRLQSNEVVWKTP